MPDLLNKQVWPALVETKGFDLPCGAGRVAALTCRRHVIHSRSRSNPFVYSGYETGTEAPDGTSVPVWWRRRDSNPRPLGCEPNALPAELRPHRLMYYNTESRFVKLFLQPGRNSRAPEGAGRGAARLSSQAERAILEAEPHTDRLEGTQ